MSESVATAGIDKGERLQWGSAADLSIHRRRNGRGFVYVDTDGCRITASRDIKRIRALAIPPAYRDVLISRDPRSHLQATGRDSAGRIQYRYHPNWEHLREAQKEGRIATLCRVLPKIRRAVARDLANAGVGRERVLAAVVTPYRPHACSHRLRRLRPFGTQPWRFDLVEA